MGVCSCSVRDPFLKFGWPVCGRWFKVSNMSGSRSRATAELRPWSLSVSARTNSPQTRPPSLSVADFRANLTDQARGGVRNVSLEVTNVVPPGWGALWAARIRAGILPPRRRVIPPRRPSCTHGATPPDEHVHHSVRVHADFEG